MKGRFVIRREKFGALIYDPDHFAFYSIDNEGYDLLKKISLHGAEELQRSNGDEPEILEYIVALNELGINDLTLQEAKFVDLPDVERSLSAPTKAYLTVTDRCNLRCKHCFGAFGEGDEMSLDQVDYVLTQLEMAGVSQIGLTGGEPFCHPQIHEIIHMIVERGFTLQTTTNGTLINQKFIDTFKKYGDKCFRLSLSFDGIPEYHDQIRGEGAFERVMKSARLLKQNGIDFAFNTVINRQNLSTLKDFLDLMYESNIYNGSFSLIVPTGRAVCNSELLLGTDPLTIQENVAFIKRCIQDFAERTRRPQYIYGASIQPDGTETYENNELAQALGIKRCAAGIYIVTICADGSLTPCIFMKEMLESKGLKCESIFKRSLLDIWRDNEQFVFARSLDAHPKCKECDYYMKECTGGCPTDAYYFYGDENWHSQYCKFANT